MSSPPPPLPAETAPYPDPPPFFTRYSDAAWIRKEADALDELKTQGATLDPPPPPTDNWTCFGVVREVNSEKERTVEEAEGAPQLFPDGDVGGSLHRKKNEDFLRPKGSDAFSRPYLSPMLL